MLQIALLKLSRCAVGVHFVSKMCVVLLDLGAYYVMVCYHSRTPQKTRPEIPLTGSRNLKGGIRSLIDP